MRQPKIGNSKIIHIITLILGNYLFLRSALRQFTKIWGGESQNQVTRKTEEEKGLHIVAVGFTEKLLNPHTNIFQLRSPLLTNEDFGRSALK